MSAGSGMFRCVRSSNSLRVTMRPSVMTVVARKPIFTFAGSNVDHLFMHRTVRFLADLRYTLKVNVTTACKTDNEESMIYAISSPASAIPSALSIISHCLSVYPFSHGSS
jgi:hypothetical protein